MQYKVRPGVAVIAGALLLAACASAPTSPPDRQTDIVNAQSRVDRAVAVIGEMRQQHAMDALLRDAKGVLIVPDYAQATWIVGGQGGVGVMAEQIGRGVWSNPAFFTIGGLSIGLQAGGEGGAIAYLLMTPRAIAPFETRTNKFRLGADVGLVIVHFSSDARISSTHPNADVVAWTGTMGLFGGDTFGLTDVVANSALNEAYYRGPVSPRQILIGAAHNPRANELDRALTTRVAANWLASPRERAR